MMEIVPKVVQEESTEGFFSDLSSVFAEYKGVTALMLVFFLLCGLGASYTLYNINPDRPEDGDTIDAELDA